MAFSTWSDLYKSMLNDLASGNWRTKSYDFDGMKKEFFAPDEFLKMLDVVERRAVSEMEAPVMRTLARGANR